MIHVRKTSLVPRSQNNAVVLLNREFTRSKNKQRLIRRSIWLHTAECENTASAKLIVTISAHPSLKSRPLHCIKHYMKPFNYIVTTGGNCKSSACVSTQFSPNVTSPAEITALCD